MYLVVVGFESLKGNVSTLQELKQMDLRKRIMDQNLNQDEFNKYEIPASLGKPMDTSSSIEALAA